MALLYTESVEYLEVEAMQKTHEDEIALLNEIDKLATIYGMDKQNREKLSHLEAKLDGYIKHVKEHFTNEERLMKKYDFPAYEMHKMAHDIFLTDLNFATKQWQEFGDIDKVINFIRKSPEWIVMHINTVDVTTSSYLAHKIENSF